VTVHEILNTTSLATVQSWVGAAASSGKWLVIIMHGLVESNPATEEYTVQDFQSIVDYVKASNIPVVTISQGIKLANPNPNLVANPGFESAAGGWADGWIRSNNNVVLDTSSNGCAPNSTNSVSINGSSSLKSGQIAIDPGKTYLQKAYFNCQSYTPEESTYQLRSTSQMDLNWEKDPLESPEPVCRLPEYGLQSQRRTNNVRVVLETASGSNLTCYIDNIVFADASGQPGPTEAAVILGNLNQAYDGQPKPVTYTTNPGGLTALITYNGSATLHQCRELCGNGVNYQPRIYRQYHRDFNNWQIDAAVTWNNPADITYGQP